MRSALILLLVWMTPITAWSRDCIGMDIPLRHNAPAEYVDVVRTVVEAAEHKLLWTVAEITPEQYPWYVFPDGHPDEGQWRVKDTNHWTSGFFPGALLWMYRLTCETPWLNLAKRWMTQALAARASITTHHNHHYQVGISFGPVCELTGDEQACEVVRTAAASLASRFNETIGMVRSRDWGPWEWPVVADSAPSTALLTRGAALGGPVEWTDLALSHWKRLRKDFIRENGSSFHLVDYDPADGSVIFKGTDQGYADGSTWGRGHAWLMRGFADCYASTRDRSCLDAERKVALQYYVKHIIDYGRPPWDFDAPDGYSQPDTSAAAIAGTSFSIVARTAPNRWEARRFARYAWATLRDLVVNNLAASDRRGIVDHCVDNDYLGITDRGVDTPCIYADYYTLELAYRMWSWLAEHWGKGRSRW
jgi:unsaturated chondroitin disaccharide hydrolase